MKPLLRPPALKDTVPPGVVPTERRITWNSLLGKPTTTNVGTIIGDPAATRKFVRSLSSAVAWDTLTAADVNPGAFPAGAYTGMTTLAVGTAYKVGANQVVGARGAAVADAVYIPGLSGATAVGTIAHAAASPPTKAEFDAAVDQINAIVTAQATNGSAINNLVTMVHDAITQLDLLLARVRASTGHGLIA